MVQTRIFLFGIWEPAVTSLIRHTLGPNDTFVDVGANIGYYSLIASRLVGPAGKVFAIEAAPPTFERLQQNVALNGSANIRTLNAAASNAVGEVDIFLSPEDTNAGAATIVATEAARTGHAWFAKVRALPLDHLIPEADLLEARMIKIDVEGAERWVLDGILSLIPKMDKATWIVEVSPDALKAQGTSAEALLDVFRKAGYRVFQINNSYAYEAYLRPGKHELTEIREVPTTQFDLVAMR